MNQAVSNHFRNLSRIVGHGVGHYEYITTRDELIASYNSIHKDLPYTLRKEVKRDRYVLNADGMKQFQKQLEDVVAETLADASAQLSGAVTEDVTAEVGEALQSLCAAAGGRMSVRSGGRRQSSLIKISGTLTSALVKNIMKLFTEVFKDEDSTGKRKRS